MPLPRPAPGTMRWWVVGVLGVAAMTAFVIWSGLRSTVGAVTPEVTGYRVLSDSSIEVDYRVLRPADRALTCVVTALDERKGVVGTVTAVSHGAGGELLVLAGPDGELLVPFVKAIVPTVDLVGGRVVLDPPEGLLDP